MSPENTYKDGRCRICGRARAAAVDPEKKKAALAAWRAANPERMREHARRSHANPAAKEKTKEWRAKNPDKVKVMAKTWRTRNREQYLETMRRAAARVEREAPGTATAKTKAWVEANPERARANSRRRSARAEAARHGVRVVDYSAAQCAAKMAYYGNKCFYCGGPFEHVDHHKPLSKGGPDMLANLRPSCASCNSRKATKWPWKWEPAA